MELRFAVVEDRLPDAQRLESLLRLAFGGGQPLVCDHYESGDAFLAAFPSKNYQVVFLDICMEGTNGIETARILRRTDPDLLLVFVTSSPEYVWDAFPVHPFDYLLKPYREEKLFQLADELRRVLFRAEPELEVRIARQQVHLPLRKIQYAMAQNHYVRIVSDDGECRTVSTSLLKLGLSAVLCIIFWFTAVQWSRWLLREYRGEAFWQSAWPLPTIYAAFLVFCMPLDPAVVLINRLMIISVLAVTISLLGIFLLLYEMYQVAREYTRSAQLDRENQLLAVESRRYTELRTYMEQTRHLRHDFRQHLHVIAGLTEAGQVDELKNYLHQYESELSEERPTLCANPAVDALAGHYDHEAHSLGVPVDWRLELPRQLAIPEADFCMMLGNLLENAFHASQKLPPEQRQVKVLARMLSPAMLGLLVENRYDGVLKRQQGILHSTKHDGMGIGLVSIQTAVSRYGGSMTVETENGLFRVNILLNL